MTGLQCRPPNRPRAHPPAVLQTMTDANKQNNTGPLSGPVIKLKQETGKH